jgi:hypothetical protein
MIYYKELQSYSVFIFSDIEVQSIRLPLAMSQREFCLFLEATLEKIKPTFIATSLTHLPSTKELEEMKKKHIVCQNNNLVFLNYSIRNQLKKCLTSEGKTIHFEEIYTDLNQYFSKK